MLIFLYGPDTYRSQEKLKEIIERYKKIHKSGLNLISLDLNEKSFADFDNYLRSTPMFKEKKLIVLKNAFSNNDFKIKFLEKKNDYRKSQDIIVFYEENVSEKNDSLFKFLKQNGKSQEFGLLSGQKLKNWAKKEFEKYGTTIELGALEKLTDFVGSDLWRLSNEIKKLVSYSREKEREIWLKSDAAASDLSQIKKKKIIRTEDIKLLIKPKIDTDIFKTIDAIAEKNKNKAISLIHKHLKKGDSPLYLLAMINFQFRNLLIVKSRCQSTNNMRMIRINSLAKELRMHPFVARKSSWQAKRFNFEELKKIYQQIFQADLNIKTGKINPEIALDLLIAEI